jgi:hypothetical protein
MVNKNKLIKEPETELAALIIKSGGSKQEILADFKATTQ